MERYNTTKLLNVCGNLALVCLIAGISGLIIEVFVAAFYQEIIYPMLGAMVPTLLDIVIAAIIRKYSLSAAEETEMGFKLLVEVKELSLKQNKRIKTLEKDVALLKGEDVTENNIEEVTSLKVEEKQGE